MWEIIPGEEVETFNPNDMKVRDPERYKCIEQLIKDGCSIKTIGRSTRASHHTIYKIMARSQDGSLGMSALTNKLNRAANQSLDRISEIMEDPEQREKVAFKDLSVLAGIATDKCEKLAGSQVPVHQTNIQINVKEAQNLSDMLKDLPGDSPTIEVNDQPSQSPQDVDSQDVG